jgi:cold shock CspA family protein
VSRGELRDRFGRCEECSTEFVYTVAEQRQMGTALPRLCPGCRALARRLADKERAGHVKWYDRRKGYGFLVADTGEDVFVHRSALAAGLATLRPGQRVLFKARSSVRGAEAVHVRAPARKGQHGEANPSETALALELGEAGEKQ